MLDPVRDWIVMDAETASWLDISRVTSDVYASHPSTMVHTVVLVACHAEGGREVIPWSPGADLPEHIVDAIRAGIRIVAWNVGFERAIHKHLLLNLGWPRIDTAQWRDAQCNSVAVNCPPALAKAAVLVSVGKDLVGASLMKRLAVVAPDGAGGWSAPSMTATERDRLVRYCMRDSIVTDFLYQTLPALTPFEFSVWQEDQQINQRGVRLDTERAACMAELAAQRETALGTIVRQATGGGLEDVKGHPALRRWLFSRGVIEETGSVNAEAIQALLLNPDTPEDVRMVCQCRQESGKLTSLAKLKRLPDVLSSDGRARGLFSYSSALTGRWASRHLQLHNLRKDRRPAGIRDLCALAIDSGDLDSLSAIWSPLDALSQSLRSLVVPAPGYDFIGSDFSAIEAHVLPWLARDTKKLEFLFDYYRRLDAWDGSPETKPKDIYVINAERSGSTNRNFGKVQELGLGYGMGAATLLTTASSWGVELSRKEAGKGHGIWRDHNQPIVKFWSELEDAFSEVIRGASSIDVGRLTIRKSGSAVLIRLPSGRHIWYHKPRLVEGSRTVKWMDREGQMQEFETDRPQIEFTLGDGSGFHPLRTYGGTLAENVTQAVARDLLAHAMLTLRGTPYSVVLHVHDSLVAELPEGEGDPEELSELICDLPSWADGLPLRAEGYRSKRFLG